MQCVALTHLHHMYSCFHMSSHQLLPACISITDLLGYFAYEIHCQQVWVLILIYHNRWFETWRKCILCFTKNSCLDKINFVINSLIRFWMHMYSYNWLLQLS